ncbi:hypothetical protein ACHAWX_005213 [Stephanocyclus meneghinianus]
MSPDYLHDQVRVAFSTAASPCHSMGKRSCDFNDIGDLAWFKTGYHWLTDRCMLKAKVNAFGLVALVYEPDDYPFLYPHIDVDNRNYFKVCWDGDYPLNDNDIPKENSCGHGVCESLSTGGCLCGTSITRSVVFKTMLGSVNEVLSKYYIGTFHPSAYDDGTFAEQLQMNRVTAYMTAVGINNLDTAFLATDLYG